MGEDSLKLTKEQIPEWLTANLGPIVGELVKEQTVKSNEDLKNGIVGEFNKRHDDLLADIVSRSKGPADQELTEEQRSFVLPRIIRALAAADGNWDQAAQLAKDNYQKDGVTEIAVQCMEAKAFKAGSPVHKQLAAGDFAAGGALTFTTVAADFVGLLRNRTAVRQLGARMVPMPTGSVTLMEQTGGATAQWVGENIGQNASAETFGQIKLTAKKLRVTVPVSNDLLLSASPDVDALVRDDAVQQASVKEDVTYLRGMGVEAYAPKGLAGFIQNDAAVKAVNYITSAGTALANITTDLGALVVALLNQNMPMTRPGWIVSPRSWNKLATIRDGNGNFAFRDEVMAGRLWGWPLVYTNQIPINLGGSTNTEIYLADFDQCMIGEQGAMDLLVSREASYKNSSGTLVSAYDLDQTVVRLILRLDFQLRYKYAAAMVHTATW